MFTDFTRQVLYVSLFSILSLESLTDLSVEASATMSTTVVFILQVTRWKSRFLFEAAYLPSQVLFTTLIRKSINKWHRLWELELLAMFHSYQNREGIPSMPTFEIYFIFHKHSGHSRKSSTRFDIPHWSGAHSITTRARPSCIFNSHA